MIMTNTKVTRAVYLIQQRFNEDEHGLNEHWYYRAEDKTAHDPWYGVTRDITKAKIYNDKGLECFVKYVKRNHWLDTMWRVVKVKLTYEVKSICESGVFEV